MQASFVETDDGRRLAYQYLPGKQPVVVFLCGLCSNMNGNKALHIEAYCRARGQAKQGLKRCRCIVFRHKNFPSQAWMFPDLFVRQWLAHYRPAGYAYSTRERHSCQHKFFRFIPFDGITVTLPCRKQDQK